MTPQERHANVVERYPGGLTQRQFQRETLLSADEEGKLDPPALADWFGQQSWLIGMWMAGLIERTGIEVRASERTGPWVITEKGRRWLIAHGALPATHPQPPLDAEGGSHA